MQGFQRPGMKTPDGPTVSAKCYDGIAREASRRSTGRGLTADGGWVA